MAREELGGDTRSIEAIWAKEDRLSIEDIWRRDADTDDGVLTGVVYWVGNTADDGAI